MTRDAADNTEWWQPDATETDDLERQCVFAAELLWRELRDIFGHVSRRLPGTETFLIKPIRVALTAPEDVLVADLDGRLESGTSPLPRETAIHAEILRARPDVHAVVHAHPHHLTALSAAGQTVRPITQQAARFGREVLVTAGDFVESPDQGARLAAALGGANEIIQKGHGAVTAGENVPAAVGSMLYLEQAAQQFLLASSAGQPAEISDSMLEHPLHSSRTGGPVLLWHQLVWESERWPREGR